MKRAVKILCGLIICFMVGIMALYSVAYFYGAPQLNKNRYIKMYDNKEEVFYQSVNDFNGKYVPLKNISKYFLNSIVAIEDHRFYEHRGFDPIGIMRAMSVNLTSMDNSQGASSITQQYARLLYLTNEKSWSRKTKEAFLTMQLETHLTKDEILEGYVNSVYFGHGIYGVENAAKYFYNKSAKELDLNESSMLAGIVNGPSYYSPLIDEKAAKERQKLVLDALIEEDKITKMQKETVTKSPINLAQEHTINKNMSYHFYKDTVIEELKELGYYTDSYINRGLNIYTTMDTGYQDALNESTKNNTKDLEVESASVIVEPYTSKILALTGGKDYSLSQYNRATQANRQIGSTIKPFLYYAALQNGFTPATKFLDEPTTFKLEDGSTYSPSNYNDKYAYKEITLAQAIAVSDNIFAVKTHLFLGEQTLASLLEELGLKDVPANPSLALGTLNTNVYKLSDMYNTLASEGEYQPIYTIESITDNEGNPIYQREEKPKQLLDKDNVLVLNQLLTGSFDKRFSTYLSATMQEYKLPNINAVKTGTSNWDGLAVGYNPNVVITSWVGYDDNRELTEYKERVVSKNIMVDMLNYTNEVKDYKWYKPTDNIDEISIDPLTGEFNETGAIYWFKKDP